MDIEQKLALMEYLESFTTPERRAKIDHVLAQRTRYITVVAEDFHNAHNASAILRTCEGLGIQDIHVVENFNTFKARRGAASGSAKWVNLYRYDSEGKDNTQACLNKLRSQGYRLVATSSHGQALPPEVLPLDQKLALLLGSERYGLSSQAQAQADLQLKIPMVGFIESFNVSVSAALCLYTLTRRLRTLDLDWSLSDREKLDLRLDWIRHSARHNDHLEQHFLALKGQENRDTKA
ncbi:MAG: RNA methyltransferase [Cyanobacteria bacterium P01_F01_bin.86]